MTSQQLFSDAAQLSQRVRTLEAAIQKAISEPVKEDAGLYANRITGYLHEALHAKPALPPMPTVAAWDRDEWTGLFDD